MHGVSKKYLLLATKTFAALIWGFQENSPTETNVLIQGIAMTVYASSNHFEYVDLMGQDFMVVAIRGLVTVDYPCKIVNIHIK